jgi:hypothetical protein
LREINPKDRVSRRERCEKSFITPLEPTPGFSVDEIGPKKLLW